MGTRCAIHFMHVGDHDPVANVYQHWDGDPESVAEDLGRFFDAVEEQVPGDTRFADPSYLAAKFVVWKAWEAAKSTAAIANILAEVDGKPTRDTVAPLAFKNVGIDTEDADDLAYVHEVRCYQDRRRPEVASMEAR